MSQQQFSLEEKRKAVERELALRKRNYPRWVASNRMTQIEADRQIAVMEAIVADYARMTPLEHQAKLAL
jgi:hypothetical protein